MLLGSERDLFPLQKAAELSGCLVRPGLLPPAGKSGAELGGMATGSVLAGMAELPALALVSCSSWQCI